MAMVVFEGGKGVADDEVVVIVDVGMLVEGGRVVVDWMVLVLIGIDVVLKENDEMDDEVVGVVLDNVAVVLLLVEVGACGKEEVMVGAGKNVARVLCGIKVSPASGLEAVGVGVGIGVVTGIDMLMVSFLRHGWQ